MALDLSEIRQQITQIDRSLLKLLSERHVSLPKDH